ncbi:MAG: nucleoside deaminase [Proteobacteria bacterium]|nr:nucleoside deaminase [Pseudomonadota bacterium]
MEDHQHYMREALALGETAGRAGNQGVGAVIVRDGKVVGRGRNRIKTATNPLMHAETDAIADACRALGTSDLSGTTLYTTMEPCPMCAGALLQARIGAWVVGGRFKSVGRTDMGRYSIESFADFVAADVTITSGVLQQECEALRNRYFPRK